MNIQLRTILQRAVLLTWALGMCSCVFFQQEYPFSKDLTGDPYEDGKFPPQSEATSGPFKDEVVNMAEVRRLRHEMAALEEEIAMTSKLLEEQTSARKLNQSLALEESKLRMQLEQVQRRLQIYEAASSLPSDTEDRKEGSRGGRRSLDDKGARTESNVSEGSRGGRAKKKDEKPVLIP